MEDLHVTEPWPVVDNSPGCSAVCAAVFAVESMARGSPSVLVFANAAFIRCSLHECTNESFAV